MHGPVGSSAARTRSRNTVAYVAFPRTATAKPNASRSTESPAGRGTIRRMRVPSSTDEHRSESPGCTIGAGHWSQSNRTPAFLKILVAVFRASDSVFSSTWVVSIAQTRTAGFCDRSLPPSLRVVTCAPAVKAGSRIPRQLITTPVNLDVWPSMSLLPPVTRESPEIGATNRGVRTKMGVNEVFWWRTLPEKSRHCCAR